VAGETVTLNGVEVVIPVAVALIDLGCDSLELTSTIGTLEATPLLKDTFVAEPKFVALTVGLFVPITLDPLKVNDSVPL
jgi:hypothetical protein